MGVESQAVTGRELQVLLLVVRRLVDTTVVVPALGGQGTGIVGLVGLGEGVHEDFTAVVELRFVVALAQKLVFQLELGLDGIRRGVGPSLVGDSHGVTVVDHVGEEVRRFAARRADQTSFTGSGRHDEVLTGVDVFTYTVGSFAVFVAINRHVRHGVVCTAEEVARIVLLVLRVSQGEGGGELDAVRHPVVEGETGRQAVEGLLDDGTRFVVVRTGHTEVGLFTTTRYRHAVVVRLTELCDFVYPIRVLVVVTIIRGVVLEVHDFRDARLLFREDARVVISLLQHHGVAVTVQHIHAGRLPSTRETVAEVHLRLTAGTTTGGDFDYTVRTSRTPDSGSGGVLQHLDAGDIFGGNLEKGGKLLFVLHVVEVEVVVVIVFEDVAVHNDERFLATVDRGNTTQTHARA